MPIKILMPALSPTMEEGKLAKWLVKEGDKVESGDIIAEVETDKATIEYESTEEGIVGKIIIAEGTEGVKVNDLIAVLLEDGEDASSIDGFIETNKGAAPTDNITEVATETKEESPKTPFENTISSNTSSNHTSTKKVFISPLAKRIALENGLDINSLKGTGPAGRIVKKDIENTLQNSSSKASVSNTSNTVSVSADSLFEDRTNSGMRKTIAKRLLESKQTVPHYYLTIDCNMDNLLQARKDLNIKGDGKFKISVNDFIIKAVALALQDVPDANASWMEDITRYFSSSDVAVAVAIDNGLITPIVKTAEKKGLVEISNEMKSLVKKAKEGKLAPSEYQGGSFSISNLGMFGVKDFCAIVNPPHAGILAIGGTVQKPIVKNGEIIVANIMSVTLSADHRVIDGAIAAQFLQAFKGYIESPVSMIL